MGADDSFFSWIPLRKEPCVYCAQVCTSEPSQALNTALNSTCTCVLLTLSTHSCAGDESMPWCRSEVLSCKLSVTCVSLCFPWKWKFQDQKIYFWSLQFTRCPFWVHFLCFKIQYIVHQNICMWEFRETSCLVKQFLSVVFTQELPLERGEEDGYLLYLVLLSFFISVAIAVLLVLLIACRRCCEGERSFARWDKSL